MDLEQAYQQALDYLYSFVDYSLTHQQNLSPENFDLTRMFALMAALGDPQNSYPIIHVAGTKGKGSVAAFCTAALQAGGYKTGLFTSPHLKDFEERIQINGQPISRRDLVGLVDLIKPTVAAIPKLTTFEITTALGFWHFARQGVDAAVIEVGLGGRLDSTNVVTPEVAVITSISHDHTALLGNTLELIAAEKAGIIKAGVPVVLAPQKAVVPPVVAEIAAERAAPLTQVEVDYAYRLDTHSLDGQTFSIWRAAEGAQNNLQLQIPLLGVHQIENAATAYAALQVFRQHSLPLSDDAIRAGFARTVWQARFEVLQRDPPVVVDAAHNSYSAQTLRQALEDYFPDLPVVLVFGVSADKDVDGMLQALLPRLRAIITTQSDHPRAMHPDQLAEVVRRFGLPVTAQWQPRAALDEALSQAGADGLVLCTGSVFVAASFRIAWFEKLAEM